MSRLHNTHCVKLEKVIRVFLFFLVLVLLSGFKESNNTQLVSLYDGWYRVEDGKKIDVKLPGFIPKDSSNNIVLYNDSLSAEDVNKVISFDEVTDGLSISVGDNILYKYQDTSFVRNKQMKGKLWADAVLPVEISDIPLCVTYKNVKDSKMLISPPVIGSLQRMASFHMQNSNLVLFITQAMFCLSIISSAIYSYMKHHGIQEKRFLDVALFLCICSYWCRTDSGLFQVNGKFIAKGSLLSFYAFMLMSVPMVHFVKNTVHEDKKWLPRLWSIVLYCNAILQGIVHLVFKIQFIKMLSITHVLLFTGVISMTYLLWKEYKQYKTKELELCLNAFGLLGASGIFALLLYWLLQIPWYDAIFQFGILLFVIILFLGIIQKVSNDISFHIEQTIYEKMSMEDQLTGLQNKKAFDKFMNEQIVIKHKKDTIWLLIHLDDLREINRIYGFDTGDEIVIAASSCIKKACNSITGNSEDIFRIKGDEFVAVIKNPAKDEKEYIQLIEDEVKKYNLSNGSKCKFHLSYQQSLLKELDNKVNAEGVKEKQNEL